MVRFKRIKKKTGRKIDIPIIKTDYPYERKYWDDWEDHRDGFRGYGDKSKIHRLGVPKKRRSGVLVNGSEWFSKMNRKLKRLTRRRKVRKSIGRA